MKYNFNITVGFFLTGILYCLGGWDKALQSLGIFIMLDYFTGILSSLYNKNLSAEKGFKGVLKKGAYIAVVMTCVEIDRFLKTDGTWRNIVIYALCVNDILSIFENLAKLNIKLPNSLKKLLKDFDEYDISDLSKEKLLKEFNIEDNEEKEVL